MRKVILFMHMSLDGFVAGPNGEMDWIVSDQAGWDDVIVLQNTADTALFGRVNFEGFEGYWRAGAVNQASTKSEVEHAHWLENATKIVFSRTLEKTDWAHTRIVRDHIAQEIATLKQQPGKNMILFGGAGIASAFTDAGLIDEYRVNVNPVILGGGKPLFKNIDSQRKLKLIDSKASPSGVVTLRYATES